MCLQIVEQTSEHSGLIIGLVGTVDEKQEHLALLEYYLLYSEAPCRTAQTGDEE